MPRQKTSYEGIKVTWRDWTWRQRNGSPIRIINMDDAHLVNTMRGLLRRILPISLAFHYVSFRVNRNKYNDLHKIQDAVYTYATRLMIQHAHQQNFGEGWRRWCDHLTALRLEADARGLDWWDHDRRCRCDGCAMRAREAAKFMEQNPNYRHME